MKQSFTVVFILWLFLLAIFSTSHLGNNHHYSGTPGKAIHSTTCADESHHHSQPTCPWENAFRLLTACQTTELYKSPQTYQFRIPLYSYNILFANEPLHQFNRGPPSPSMI